MSNKDDYGDAQKPDQAPMKEMQKLTDWDNEPQLRALKEDLRSARPSQQEVVRKIKKWNDLRDATGASRPKKRAGRSSIQPRLVRRQAEWRKPALSEPFLNTPNMFQVDPRTFEDMEAARQNQLVLNYQFDMKLNKVQFIDTYIGRGVDDGTAIIRYGWERETRQVTTTVPAFDHFEIENAEQQQMIEQALIQAEQDPRMFREKADPALVAAVEFYHETGSMTYAVQNGTETVTEEKVIKNQPTVSVVNPSNVYLDPSCNGNIDNAMFCIFSFESSKAELKKDSRYKNLDAVDWEGVSVNTESDHETMIPGDFDFADLVRKKVVVYEYWGYYDIHGNGTLEPIVACWIGETMIRMELNPFPDQRIPFIFVPYLNVADSAFGEADAEVLGDNQTILGALMRGMVDIMGRTATGQKGVPKGFLDPLNRLKFDSGEVYEYNPNVATKAPVLDSVFPEIPSSAYNMLSMQNQEAEGMTGVRAFAGGISGDQYGKVATGIRGALDAASKREMSILRRLAQGIAELGRRIIAMNAVFLSEEEVVRITNSEFITVARDELAGEFDLRVDISTAEVDEQKSQDLAFMLQTVGPNTDFNFMRMILVEIAELKRMPRLAQELRNFVPTPDPLQQRKMEAEVRKMELENEEIQSKIALNQAKTKEALMNADRTEREDIEAGLGVTHERQVEQDGAQAKANQNLEVTKALLKPKKEGESDPNIEAAVGFNEISRQTQIQLTKG